MSKEDKAYIVQLVKQIIHPYFAEAIADILIAHGVTFKVEPQTNADHIRGMTDEELAEWLCARFDCYGDVPCPAEELCYADHNGMLDWLQQPHKEDENDHD